LGMAVNTVASSLLQMVMGPVNMAASDPAAGQKIMLAMINAIGKVWPYYLALQLISMVLQAGLTNGAAANAYSLVTGGDEIAPPPAKALA
jgi:hypothetical protein